MFRLLQILALMVAPVAAQALVCNSEYRVQNGDTVFTIAQRVYGDAEKWTLIYYANEESLTQTVFQVNPGDSLFVPCEPGAAAPQTGTLVSKQEADLKLLAGSNWAPFTHLDWPGQGLVTEIVHAAMSATSDQVSYSLDWENDWSQHLFPLLDSKVFDMGFPWYKPPCDIMPENERCKHFHFSEPLLEVLMLLFVRSDTGFVFQEDADLIGKRICRPAGYSTYDLDRPGREFLTNGQVTLLIAEDEAGCFDMIMTGEADAAYFNIFVGAQYVVDLGLRGQVVPLEKPLGTATLHAVISKNHWRGTTLLYRFNEGVQKLRESERYNEIVTRQMETYWNQIRTQ